MKVIDEFKVQSSFFNFLIPSILGKNNAALIPYKYISSSIWFSRLGIPSLYFRGNGVINKWDKLLRSILKPYSSKIMTPANQKSIKPKKNWNYYYLIYYYWNYYYYETLCVHTKKKMLAFHQSRCPLCNYFNKVCITNDTIFSLTIIAAYLLLTLNWK